MPCGGCAKRRAILKEVASQLREGNIAQSGKDIAKIAKHLVRNPPMTSKVRRVVIK